MKLRTRLILALLLISVVPLGAVTLISYASNVKALKEDGAHEADMLAFELSQRMQLVTAQLTERVEHLMDIAQLAQQPEPKVAATQKTTPVKTTPAAAPATPEPAIPAPPPLTTLSIDQNLLNAQVATALGEAAILLNSVEMPNFRGFPGGGRRGGGPPPGGRGDQSSSIAASASTSGTQSRVGVGSGAGAGGRGANAQGDSSRGNPNRPPQRFQRPPDQGPTLIVTSDDGVKIDLQKIRRDLYRQILPQGQNADQLTPEERQKVIAEVNQRMLGIVEGIKLSAAEVQKKADEAKAAAAKAAVAPPPTPVPPPTPPSTATLTAAKPVAPAKPPAAPEPPPTTRRSALQGNRLDVSMVQDGKVVRAVNAEVNLPNLLATVFSSTRREQGEVPFAVGPDAHIYTMNDTDRATVDSLGSVATPQGPLGTTMTRNWIVVTTKDPSGSGLRFGIARPYGDSLSALRRTAGRNAGLGLLFIGLAIAVVVPLSSSLTKNLTTLTEGVRRIATGDFSARVPVKAHDEIGDLATAFNRMAADVEAHQRAVVGQERIKRELELGRQIQHDMLPHEPLRVGLTEIQGVSVPAREVGGDFFNYFALPSGHLALLVGDVSGKGVGAALLMANIQASLRTRFALGQDLSAIAHEIDREIPSTGSMYATLFIGILDSSTRVLRYVNAGHNPQFVLRKQGGLERMKSTGLPVGLLAGQGYTERSVDLAAGDLVFFYTDGCVETESETDEMFGADRLEKLLQTVGAGDPDKVLQIIESALQQFRGSRELYDDATMMAVRIG